MIDVNWNPSRRELRVFAGLFLVFFVGVGGWLAGRPAAATWAPWIGAMAVCVGGLGLAWPAAVRPVYRVWMAAALPIGWVVSHGVLAAVYFGILLPIGWILRRCGYDPLRRRQGQSATSDWTPRPSDRDISRYFRQF